MDKGSLADSEFFYERETEFFGFTPFQFLDGVGEIVVRAVFSMFDRLGTVTLPAKVSSLLSPGQIEAGVGQWSALVEGRFGRNYELFEAYVVKNVLLLPDAFVMPHHRGLAPVASVESEGLLDGELADLAGRLQAARSMDASLDAEERALREEEQVLSRMEQQLDALKAKLAAAQRKIVVSGKLMIYHLSLLVGPFEQLSRALGAHLGALKSIVLETIEHSRNLSALEESPSLINYEQQSGQPWAATMTTAAGHPLDLERELTSCLGIADFPALAVLPRII